MQNATQSFKKRILSTLLLLLATSVLFLYHWTAEVKETAHVKPTVERYDISGLIQKVETDSSLSEAELRILSVQTGLSETTINTLFRDERMRELLTIQNLYFAPVTIEEFHTTPLTVSEWLAGDIVPGYEGMPMVDIRNGDILITKNSRFLGWRNGHAGLIVDAEKGLVLEAIMLGSPSQLCRIEKWESYPSFLVLRLREEFMISAKESGGGRDAAEGVGQAVSGNIAENVASYALQHLEGVPYRLLAGMFSRKLFQGASEEENTVVAGLDSNVAEVSTAPLSDTQCAHLVWYAYKQFGIDLDSDGGLFVTPYDIQNSPYLEVVQSYGY